VTIPRWFTLQQTVTHPTTNPLVNFDILYFSTDGCINKSLTYKYLLPYLVLHLNSTLIQHYGPDSDGIPICFVSSDKLHCCLISNIQSFSLVSLLKGHISALYRIKKNIALYKIVFAFMLILLYLLVFFVFSNYCCCFSNACLDMLFSSTIVYRML